MAAFVEGSWRILTGFGDSNFQKSLIAQVHFLPASAILLSGFGNGVFCRRIVDGP